jgi:hypothetical protein
MQGMSNYDAMKNALDGLPIAERIPTEDAAPYSSDPGTNSLYQARRERFDMLQRNVLDIEPRQLTNDEVELYNQYVAGGDGPGLALKRTLDPGFDDDEGRYEQGYDETPEGMGERMQYYFGDEYPLTKSDWRKVFFAIDIGNSEADSLMHMINEKYPGAVRRKDIDYDYSGPESDDLYFESKDYFDRIQKNLKIKNVFKLTNEQVKIFDDWFIHDEWDESDAMLAAITYVSPEDKHRKDFFAKQLIPFGKTTPLTLQQRDDFDYWKMQGMSNFHAMQNVFNRVPKVERL